MAWHKYKEYGYVAKNRNTSATRRAYAGVSKAQLAKTNKRIDFLKSKFDRKFERINIELGIISGSVRASSRPQPEEEEK